MISGLVIRRCASENVGTTKWVDYEMVTNTQNGLIMRSHVGDEYTYSLRKVIFTLKGKKLVSHGAWALLASVIDIQDMKGNLASTFVIQEFEDLILNAAQGPL